MRRARVTINGKRQTLDEHCADAGISFASLKQRKRRGETLEEALGLTGKKRRGEPWRRRADSILNQWLRMPAPNATQGDRSVLP
jgi:hypothetical protein